MQSKSDIIKKYFKNSYAQIKKNFLEANTKKILKVKLSLIFVLAIIVFTTCFVVRQQIIDGEIKPNDGFIHFVNPIANSGISFSVLADASPAAIILVQLIPAIIGLLFIVFLRKWWTLVPVILITFGGLCNLIDRFIDDRILNEAIVHKYSVIDYFSFNFSYGIFNLPDVAITIGLILCVVALIYYFVSTWKKERKNKVKKESKNE